MIPIPVPRVPGRLLPRPGAVAVPLLSVFVLFLLRPPTAHAGDCTRDVDCPGDAVCEDGECTDPFALQPGAGFLHPDPDLTGFADRVLAAYASGGSAAAHSAAGDDARRAALSDELGVRVHALEEYLRRRVLDRAIDELPDREVVPFADDPQELLELARERGLSLTGDVHWAEEQARRYAELRGALEERPRPAAIRDPRPLAWATIAPEAGLVVCLTGDDQLWSSTAIMGRGEIRPSGRVGKLLTVGWEAKGGPTWGVRGHDRLASGFFHVRATLGLGPSSHRWIYETRIAQASTGDVTLSWHAPRYAYRIAHTYQGYLGTQANVWPDRRGDAALTLGFRYSYVSGFRWNAVLSHQRYVPFRTRAVLLDAHLFLGRGSKAGAAGVGIGGILHVSAGALALQFHGFLMGRGYGQIGVSIVGGTFSSPSIRQAHALHEAGEWQQRRSTLR